jgi:uncharacterized membrane protein YkvA (DUF1232 family)
MGNGGCTLLCPPSRVTALWQRLRFWARLVLRDGLALYIAARHPRTPWFAKLLALLVAAYALSPIDLIPDAIPVLGFLDELILLPIAISLIARLIPAEVMAESRVAAQAMVERPRSKAGAAIIIGMWVLAAGALLWWVLG